MTKIRKKRLIIEVLVILLVVSAIMLAIFLPWLFAQSPKQDEYSRYKELYHAVERHGTNPASDPSLEEKLANSLDPDHLEGTQVYFNLRARANYYANRGFYQTAILDLEKALKFAPDGDEYIDSVMQLVTFAHQIKDYDKEAEYQRILDRI